MFRSGIFGTRERQGRADQVAQHPERGSSGSARSKGVGGAGHPRSKRRRRSLCRSRQRKRRSS